MISQLQEWATERGFRMACGGVRVLHDVRAELERRSSSGELDANFHAENLGFFRYERSCERFAEIKAVIMVAFPAPAHRLRFELPSGPFEVNLPPTYMRYRAKFKEIQDDVTSAIPALRGHLEVLVAPLKAVASRLGLVTYGRNNVTYIPEWGSYFQLVGYITDTDIGVPDNWLSEPSGLMPDCEACGLCASICPAGAIDDERVLLHAEACTTLFSEKPGNLERELSADCLFGCLECQLICPVNKGLLRVEPAGVSFDRRETEAILAGCAGEGDDAIAAKLALLGLTEQPLIPRNLAHLVARQARTL